VFRREVYSVDLWPKGISTVTLFVEDVAATKRFYHDVFGVRLKYEDEVSAVFDFAHIQVNLLDATAVPELIEPAVMAPPGAGSRLLLTIDVDDVDAICAELATRGVTLLNGPMDRPWGIRTASFRDPAGHIWEIAH
jgi:catechol 2,3-dioxygenase-like lactoylglutathione lyase family enzyme